MRAGAPAGRCKGSGGGRPGASSALALLLGISPKLRRLSIMKVNSGQLRASHAPKGLAEKKATTALGTASRLPAFRSELDTRCG
jgi:hypothetical protein